MKEAIHPDYHMITVVMTDGTKYETRSTWGKPGDVLQLDVDPKTHPAWVGGVNLRKTGQMEKFTNKFAFLDKAPTTAPKTGPVEAAPRAEKKADGAKKADAKKADKKGDAKPAAAATEEAKAE